VLQSGVWSNAVEFTVDTLTITSVYPTSGAVGDVITITGSGFGDTQGTGTVILGSLPGIVQDPGWSHDTIVAKVASGSVTGVARVQQGGVWSNAVTFTVTGPGAMTMAPNVLNLVVGDTRTLQALDGTSHAVTGLNWVSSDPTVVSLSGDDPPVLTAVAAGHVTVTAGAASADVTVWDPSVLPGGTLPVGTVLWSNPGNGSGVTKIVPAVPSASGVADVFAFQGDGTVAAITADGLTAWTADVSGAYKVIPDFQGGLVVSDSSGMRKLDGATGTPKFTTEGPANFVVHPDGTIIGVGCGDSPDDGVVIGIDGTTGGQKFQVPIQCKVGMAGGSPELIIAGDGYAYITHAYPDGPVADAVHMRLKVLRVDTSGAYNDIDVYDYWLPFEFGSSFQMITNADQGVMISWNNYEPNDPNDSNAMGKFVPHMALVTGGSASVGSAPQVPGLDTGSAVVPVLQAQDGSYVGTFEMIEGGEERSYMVGFDQSGSVRWMVEGYTPQIATDDGGVVATDDSGAAVTFDQDGNATGQIPSLPTESWIGNEYFAAGSVVLVSMPPMFPDATSYWPQVGANPSGNGTAFVQCPCLLQSATAVSMQAAASAESAVSAAGAPLKTYIILEGDPGLNLREHRPHNVKDLFHLAALTETDALNSQGNLASTPIRVSSIQDFARQLEGNGPITGGVVYFGHGARQPYTDASESSILAPGEQAGADTNIGGYNVNILKNTQLDQSATITLHACFAGWARGWRHSIAQIMADRLQRKVYAPPAGTFFTQDSNSTFTGGSAPKLPNPVSKPVYLLPDFGSTKWQCFAPGGSKCQ